MRIITREALTEKRRLSSGTVMSACRRGAVLMLLFLSPFMAKSQCTNTSDYGIEDAPVPPGSVSIGSTWAGEYNTFDQLVVGVNYSVTSSVPSDYITVRSGSSSGPVVAFGQVPLDFTTSVAGTHYVHVNTNASCGTENVSRTITMSALLACNNTVANGTATAPISGSSTITCQNAGEYGTWNNLVAGTYYSLTSTVPTDVFTIRKDSSDGAIVISGISPIIITGQLTGTYYIHVNSNTNCGTEAVCRDITMTEMDPFCTNTISYGTNPAPTPGSSETVSCAYAEEYNTWTGLTAGKLYTATSSIATDFLTVRKDSSDGAIVISGVQPLNFTAPANGTYFIHVNTDSNCGTESECRAITLSVAADVDLELTAIASPTSSTCLTSSENVQVTITNEGLQNIDFTTTPLTINAEVAGVNPMTFTPVVISTGTIAAGSSQNFNIATGYDMSASGTYTFNAELSLTGDQNSLNDSIAPVVINVSGGTVAANRSNLCSGDSVLLTLSGFAGTIQWEESTDGGTTWVNSTGTGSTTASYYTKPTDTTDYRTLVCGVTVSTNVVTVNVASSPAPTAVTGDSRCGDGTVNLSATGPGTLNWYANPTGGASLATGATYNPTVTGTTNFYVSNFTGTTESVGMVDRTVGEFQASGSYLVFDVLTPTTLLGVHVYPEEAGNVVLELRDNTGNLITSSTVAVSATDADAKTFIPLNWSLTPGTDYTIGQGTASVGMFRNEEDVVYPYTLPGVISITDSENGSSFYYFSYDWRVAVGCNSVRSQVTATVNALPDASFTGTTSICENESAVTMVPTVSGGTFSGNGITGSSFDPSVAGAGTHNVVYALTDANSCTNSDTVEVTVKAAPVVSLGSDVTICDDGSSTTLDAGTGFDSYLWSDNSTDQTLTVSTAGEYIVTVTDANGCDNSDTINVIVETCVGVKTFANASNVTVSPNPSKGTFRIAASNLTGNTLLIEIVDLQGKQIYSAIENTSKEFAKDFDVSNVSKGVYILKMNDGTSLKTERLIIE